MSAAIGLDLSLTGTGMSDGHETWLIRSSGKVDATLAERHARLDLVLNNVVYYMGEEWPTSLIVVEGPAFASKTGHMHDRSGLWWRVVGGLIADGYPVAEVPPTVLKKYACSKGNASKGMMMDAAARRFPNVDTAGDDNRADALWLAAMGHDYLGVPLVTMPALNRSSLDSVRWPA